jgi:hypothetical protein
MISESESLPSIQLGDLMLRFELEEPSELGKNVALTELRETPENKANGIRELRKLLEQGKVNANLYIKKAIIM